MNSASPTYSTLQELVVSDKIYKDKSVKMLSLILQMEHTKSYGSPGIFLITRPRGFGLSLVAKSVEKILERDRETICKIEDEGLLREIPQRHCIKLDFKKIMNMTAKDFFKEILLDNLNAKKLFCGFNYRFGKNGEGDVQMLNTLCDNHGIELNVLPARQNNGEVVSSTLIRSLIAEGDVKKANELLCSEFGFSSVVEHGKKLGRTLGTPTINQSLLKELTVPKFGVYVSRVTLADGKSYCGVTNIGIKPTVGGNVPVCETWMPEYKGEEVYGQTVDIRFLEFIREEKKFADIEELKNAILENGKTALKIFNKLYERDA